MNNNAAVTQSSTPKEFRGFAIQTAKAIREANTKVIASALEQGKLYKSALVLLKRKGNKEFHAENDFVVAMTRRYIQFFETWGDFQPSQLRSLDFLVLLKLAAPKYKEVVAQLKDAAVITQQLVDSLLKQLLPPKTKATPKEVSGWKQTKNGRYYNVVLHDEETGLAVEAIAEKEKISRQKVIATAIALLKEKRGAIINFDPVAALEQCKKQGRISDYADSDGIWLVTFGDHDVEPVTPQGLQMFLRRLAA